jgi:hypothetical protein
VWNSRVDALFLVLWRDYKLFAGMIEFLRAGIRSVHGSMKTTTKRILMSLC